MNQSICNIKYLSKIPFLYCGFWMFLIFMAVGISLLLVRALAMTAVEAACGETESTNNDDANQLSDFFEKVYD